MKVPLVFPSYLVLLLVLTAWVAPALAQPDPVAGPATGQPGAPQVERVVTDYFASVSDFRRGDIIAQSDVREILRLLADAGWQPPDPQRILADTLPDSHPVVSLLRMPQGRRFMRRVSGFNLIYDRLDRVSQVSGGQRMLEAIVRLPDGERYARPKSQLPHGVPDFLELLPKNASGKVRTIRDYDKPTGRIYTADDLRARLCRDPLIPAPPR